MKTIRRRALELSADPDLLTRPVAVFDNPGDAKLEADAHLALVGNALVDNLVSSSQKRQAFTEIYEQGLRRSFSYRVLGTQWGARRVFNTTFSTVYVNDMAPVAAVIATPIGQKAVEACGAYVQACRTFGPEISSERFNASVVSPGSYSHPAELLRNGLETFALVKAGIVHHACSKRQLTPQQRAARLSGSTKTVLWQAGLTSHQSLHTEVLSVVDYGTHVDTAAGVRQFRKEYPRYPDAIDAAIRPYHGGCPLLAGVAETTAPIDRQQSPLVRLMDMTAELAVSVGLHQVEPSRLLRH